MKHYIRQDGALISSNSTIANCIEAPSLPTEAGQLWNFESEAWEDQPDLRGYREKRLEAYKALGDDAIGDFMDDIAKALDGNALIAGTDLQARIDSFNAVKAQFPKEDPLI